jgi:DNA-binding LytR/AlgR family response regulator
VQAHFVIPANYVEMVTSMSGITAKLETEAPAPPRLSGTALIVEDNLIIAMSAEVILLELGARHVETAASVNQALTSIGREKPDFALLDLNLGNENSIPVATRLTELKVPFMFATGYGERAPIPSELAEAPVVQKPYTREVVEAALARMREAVPAKD